MGKTERPDIVLCQTYLEDNYILKMNVITGRVEFKMKKSKGAFKIMDDYELNSIISDMKCQKLPASSQLLNLVLNSNFVKKYNPFKDYINSLEPNSDDTDYILNLAKTVQTKDNEYWYKVFRKWFVAMVASALNDDIINHSVLVFQGDQGIGKTTWIEKLIPQELKQYLFSGTINPNNKDTLSKLSECLLINLDELENLNRKSIGTLKQIITSTKVNIRRPYNRFSKDMPRRASFAGSVNNTQFLRDDTGSRRWLCQQALKFDYNHQVPLHKAYRQAYDLYKSGFKHWFDGAEISEINKFNERFQIISPIEELLLKYFRKPDPDKITRQSLSLESCSIERLTSTEILQRLSIIAGRSCTPNNLNIKIINGALRKHGFNGEPYKSSCKWEVIEKNEKELKDQE